MKYRFENVICEKVLDGDTIDCLIDFGFKLTKQERFRLSRINAPEVKGKEKEEGLKSKFALKELIEGKNIIIETEKKGKYGRYLAEVWTEEEPNRNINDWLVLSNLAQYKDY